jgi:hypothetical protein
MLKNKEILATSTIEQQETKKISISQISELPVGSKVGEFDLRSDGLDFNGLDKSQQQKVLGILIASNHEEIKHIDIHRVNENAVEIRQIMKNDQKLRSLLQQYFSNKSYKCNIIKIDNANIRECIFGVELVDEQGKVFTSHSTSMKFNIKQDTLSIDMFFPEITNELGVKGFGDSFMAELINSILADDKIKNLKVDISNSNYWERFGIKSRYDSPLNDFRFRVKNQTNFGKDRITISKKSMLLWLYIRGKSTQKLPQDVLQQDINSNKNFFQALKSFFDGK